VKKSDKEKLIKLINGEIDNLQAVIDRTSSKKSIEWWQREIDHYNKLKEELNPNNFIINKERWDDFLRGSIVGILAGFAIHHIITNFI
jgi:hypothetical protein